jgi:CheY-like chemotaxis protein
MATLLCVEDHPPAQMLMQAIIRELTAHSLHVASSGAEARNMARSLAPDLYIVDLDLPDTDGLSLAQALKAIHAAPVLLVSAFAEAVKDPQIATVVYAYLPKPLDPTYVAETVERALA